MQIKTMAAPPCPDGAAQEKVKKYFLYIARYAGVVNHPVGVERLVIFMLVLQQWITGGGGHGY